MRKNQRGVNSMSIEEKAIMLSELGTWSTVMDKQDGISFMVLSNGPLEIRTQAGATEYPSIHPSLPVTCNPIAATVANSWDETLGEEVGRYLGKEARALGADVVLGPGLNIKRSPWCDRNLAYISEDPYLSGKMAAAYIRGMLSNGIAVCPTYLTANRKERKGRSHSPVVDERAYRELYTTGLEIAMKEGQAKSMMSSLNQVKGISGNEGIDSVTAHKYGNRYALVKRAVRESIVLLKNENETLPLKQHACVVTMGDFIETAYHQEEGTLLDKGAMLDTNTRMLAESGLQVVTHERGYIGNSKSNEKLVEKAKKAAELGDYVLIYTDLTKRGESEGTDGTHILATDNQVELIEAVAAVNENVIVVLAAGAMQEMPWLSKVKAVVYGYLGGKAGAEAMADVLTGKYNPSGKLNETYPFTYRDTPVSHYDTEKERSREYRESIYAGYRYYETIAKPVQFAFGYGLSYTTFAYSNLVVREEGVTFTIRNVGDVDGAEIPQLYVGMDSGQIFRPMRELKGFHKVFLQAGEEKEVTIEYDDTTFRYYNVKTQNWEVEAGIYTISIGCSSHDMRLTGTIEVKGTDAAMPYNKEKLPSYFSGRVTEATDAEFEEILGTPLPAYNWVSKVLNRIGEFMKVPRQSRK